MVTGNNTGLVGYTIGSSPSRVRFGAYISNPLLHLWAGPSVLFLPLSPLSPLSCLFFLLLYGFYYTF
jgi:hypothetical protein